MGHYRKKQQLDIFQVAIIGIFKAVWWLIKLPFSGLFRKKKLTFEEKKEIWAKRDQILKHLESGNEIELRHAVLEADKLVDFTLKKKNFKGDTFADRLRSAENSMSKEVYNNIWQGHKVRNQIAHESEFRIQNSELSRAAKKLIDYLREI